MAQSRPGSKSPVGANPFQMAKEMTGANFNPVTANISAATNRGIAGNASAVHPTGSQGAYSVSGQKTLIGE